MRFPTAKLDFIITKDDHEDEKQLKKDVHRTYASLCRKLLLIGMIIMIILVVFHKFENLTIYIYTHVHIHVIHCV